MAVLLNKITLKTANAHKYGQKLKIYLDSGFVFNILSLSLAIYVNKRDGGSKIPSQYFSKIESEMPIPHSLGKYFSTP